MGCECVSVCAGICVTECVSCGAAAMTSSMTQVLHGIFSVVNALLKDNSGQTIPGI